MKNLKSYQILLVFFLVSVTFFIFFPMIDADFAGIDDHLLLSSYSGPLKDLSLGFILDTFKHYHEGLYHPLVTLSYSLEKTLFGFSPAVFHLDNIFLHTAHIFLIFFIFFKLSDSFYLSFIISALFAIHPTRVEVVCWISSRKDLVYTLFYLLSVIFYIKTYEKKKIAIYIIFSVFFYLLACLSKPMAITLPFTLLLIDSYKNNIDRKKTIIYSIYILVTLLFILITLNAHYSNATNIRFQFDMFRQATNFINAHFNILFYFDKLFLPINLYCVYPYFYDEYTSLPPYYIMYSPAVLYILIYLSFLSLRKTKVIFYGFIFFLISIIPVSSVFPIGDFVVADRYTYLPYLGLFFIFAKFILYLYQKKKIFYKATSLLLCLTIFCTLGYLTYDRTLDWKTGNYSAPTEMKFYEFGVVKKTGKKNNKKNMVVLKKHFTSK